MQNLRCCMLLWILLENSVFSAWILLEYSLNCMSKNQHGLCCNDESRSHMCINSFFLQNSHYPSNYLSVNCKISEGICCKFQQRKQIIKQCTHKTQSISDHWGLQISKKKSICRSLRLSIKSIAKQCGNSPIVWDFKARPLMAC